MKLSRLCMLFPLLSLFSSIASAGRVNNEILQCIRHTSVDKGMLTVTDSVVIQINSRYGEEAVAIPFNSMNKLKVVKAWMEDLNGHRVYDFRRSDFIDRSAWQEMSFFNDEKEKVFKPNGNQYPYRLCYTYTRQTRNFHILQNWTLFGTTDRPFREAILYLHLPKNYAIRSRLRHVTDIQTDTVGEKVMVRYVVKPPTRTLQEMQNPSLILEEPEIIVLPERFFYGVLGDNRSWAGIAQWFGTLNNQLTDLPVMEKQTVDLLLKGVSDTKDKVRILYRYLQDHTRYINVNLGIGGMKSYPASYVVENRYGDCKALSNYMKALLEYAGIPSRFVLVCSGNPPSPVSPEFPFDSFNHVTLVVPVGNDTIWLENTSSFTPMGYAGSRVANHLALLVDGNRSKLIATPTMGYAGVASSRRISVTYLDNGDASFVLHQRSRGKEYEELSSLKNNVSLEWQTYYLSETIPFKHVTIDSWTFPEVSRDSAFNDLVVRFRLKNGFEESAPGNDLLIQPRLLFNLKHYPKPGGHAVRLQVPVLWTDTTEFDLPKNPNVISLPKSVSLSSQGAVYNTCWSQSGGRIFVQKKLQIPAGTFTSEAYEQLYDFFSKVVEWERQAPLVQRVKSSKNL